jgi:hypothetical protein
MALQYSVTIRNNQLDQVESTTGVSAVMQIRTGAPPANCAAAAAGTLLAAITLPSDWMAAASAGAKTLLGTWSGTASASGTAGHFRITDSTQTTCHLQGTVGTSGADLILDNTSINSSQALTINTFTLNAGNA